MSFRSAFCRSLPLTVQDQIDELCLRFERACRGQTPPRPEDFLPQIEDAYRTFLLWELVTLEIARRRMQGEVPTADEYRRRFPELSSSLDELFPTPSPGLPGSTATLDMTSAPPDEALPVLPGYTFSGGQLGRGGMGVVWRGRDERLHRDVAVKVLRSALVAQPAIVRRFEEEAQLTSQLQHPGIPPVHETGTLVDGRPYFCMKIVKGRTLGDLLRERGEPAKDLPQFLQVFEQVCQAMGYAHSKGVIHRDLKPSNVMVGAFGEVQVMDWGLGKVLSKGRESPQPEPETLETVASVVETDRAGDQHGATQVGSVLGTYAYMPSEQASGDAARVDRRSDVFGLGAILCEILTGHPPYQGTATEIKARAQLGDIGPACERLRSCTADPTLVSLAERCLRKGLDERPADAGAVAGEVASYQAEVRQRLQRVQIERATAEAESRRAAAESREERARATAKSERRARRLAWGLAAALVLGLAGTGYFLMLSRAQWKELKRLQYAHQIGLAQTEWDANNAGNAWAHLESTDPESRGWEYRYLYHLFNRNQLTLRGHATGSILALAFSPDGKYLASAGEDKTVKVWDTGTGKLFESLEHTLPVSSVAFSPNGRFLAAGTKGLTGEEPDGQWRGEVKLWDAKSFEGRGTFGPLADEVWCVAFDPGSKLLAAGMGRFLDERRPGEIRVWDVETRQELNPLKGHDSLVMGVAFSKNGQLASGSTDGTVRIWDSVKSAQAGLPLRAKRTLEGGHVFRWGAIRVVRNVSFSPDGKHVAAAYWDGTAKIWDAVAGRVVWTLEGHTNAVHNVAFSPDGGLLATASWDGTITFWDTGTGQEQRTLKGHRKAVMGIQFSPVRRHLATGCADGTVKLWDLTQDPNRAILRGHAEEVNSVSFDPTGRWLASGSSDGTVRVWEPTKGQTPHILTKHTAEVFAVAFSADGRHLASGSGDKTAIIWDAATWQCLRSLAKHADGVMCLAFSPDGQRLATGSCDKAVMVWDASTGQLLHTLRRHTDIVSSVTFSRDGRYLATASWDGTATIWVAETGQQHRNLEGHRLRVQSVGFSPDGTRLASASQDGTVKIWEVATGREVRGPDVRGYDLLAVRFSPDERRLATADGDCNVKLWDMETGHNVLILRGHTGRPICLSFSPDGARLASGGWDKTIRIWEAPALGGTPAAPDSRSHQRPHGD